MKSYSNLFWNKKYSFKTFWHVKAGPIKPNIFRAAEVTAFEQLHPPHEDINIILSTASFSIIREGFCKSYAYIFTHAWWSQQRWDLRGTSKLWLSWVSLPNNVTCWDSSTAPLNKLQVALGNKRNPRLICLTANEENVQAVNQALKALQQWSRPRFIIYFLNWCISLSQGVYLLG